MNYIFKYKRKLFWRQINACGHRYVEEMNRMDVFKEDKTLFSIPKWSECYLDLVKDWLLATKEQIEKESGQKVSLDNA